jgi:hypothetical protein
LVKLSKEVVEEDIEVLAGLVKCLSGGARRIKEQINNTIEK